MPAERPSTRHHQKLPELLSRLEVAREEGGIEHGPLEVEPTPADEVTQLEHDAQDWFREGRATVPITIRMRPEVIDALRYEALRTGERGYQTLLKKWIDERLHSEQMVSRAELEEALEPVRHLLDLSSDSGGPQRSNRRDSRDQTDDIEVGKIYKGKVARLMSFGAFVEIVPNREGLVPTAQLAEHHVDKVEDVVNVGDEIMVKVIEIDDRGRINLSRKEAIRELSKQQLDVASAGSMELGG